MMVVGLDDAFPEVVKQEIWAIPHMASARLAKL